jgi:acyl carrier protein
MTTATTRNAGPTESDIRNWLIRELAQALDVSHDEIRTNQSFFDLGLDSSAALGLTDLLTEWLNCDIEPTMLYDYPTIEQLASALAAQR